MKRKFILLPITLTALAPAISLVGCGDTPEPVVTKYHFEFTGNHCKINGHDKLSVEIEENTKVEYTVLADAGYKLSSTQDLPKGVTLVGNLLTIAKMDKAYTATINAEPIQRSLKIEGLDASYEGTIRQEGHTGKITVNFIENGKKTDVTNFVAFSLSEPLIWDRTNEWFSWPRTLDWKEEGYEWSITANYLGTIFSDVYTTKLYIVEGDASLICEGPIDGYEYDVPMDAPGEIPAICWYYDRFIAQEMDVTNQVEVTIITDPASEDSLYWDGIRGKICWDSLKTTIVYVTFITSYTNSYEETFTDQHGFVLAAS